MLKPPNPPILFERLKKSILSSCEIHSLDKRKARYLIVFFHDVKD